MKGGKRTFAASAKGLCQNYKSGHQAVADRSPHAALNAKVGSAQTAPFAKLRTMSDQSVVPGPDAVHRWRSKRSACRPFHCGGCVFKDGPSPTSKTFCGLSRFSAARVSSEYFNFLLGPHDMCL